MNELEIIYVNPFGEIIHEGEVLKIKRVVIESTRSENQMRELLENNEIVIENEWYVLFESGTLIEKSRSKVSSSSYLVGFKHKNIKNCYEVL